MNSALVQARMHPSLKDDAEHVLHEIGMSPSEAIRVFYRQITLQKGIPFEMKIPKMETKEDLDRMNDFEKEKGLKRV